MVWLLCSFSATLHGFEIGAIIRSLTVMIQYTIVVGACGIRSCRNAYQLYHLYTHAVSLAHPLLKGVANAYLHCWRGVSPAGKTRLDTQPWLAGDWI